MMVMCFVFVLCDMQKKCYFNAQTALSITVIIIDIVRVAALIFFLSAWEKLCAPIGATFVFAVSFIFNVKSIINGKHSSHIFSKEYYFALCSNSIMYPNAINFHKTISKFISPLFPSAIN